MAKLVAKKPKAEKVSKETAATAIIPMINAKAISKDVGPRVIRGLADALKDEEKATELLAGVKTKRYDYLAELTMGVLKAAKADKSIDLTATVKNGDDGKKAMNFLNDQLGIALGFREVVQVKGKNGEQAKRVTTAQSVRDLFPSAADTDPVVKQRKNTLRSNFLTSLKKCATAALAIMERDIGVKEDKSGTLLLSGPNIKKTFGADNIRLDEKQNYQDKAGNKIELKARPSFTAIADLAKIDHGAAFKKLDNHRAASVTDPGKALLQMADGVVKACEAMRKANREPNGDEVAALEKMQSAIDGILNP